MDENKISDSNKLRDKIARKCMQEIADTLPYSESEYDEVSDYLPLITAAMDEYINTLIKREEFAEGRDHLTVNKRFQSDKFPWCAVNFVPLKLSDPAARDLLKEYARRREVIDKEFPRDLLEALENTPEKKNAGYKPFVSICDLDLEAMQTEDVRPILSEEEKELRRRQATPFKELYVGHTSNLESKLAKAREALELIASRDPDQVNYVAKKCWSIAREALEAMQAEDGGENNG